MADRSPRDIAVEAAHVHEWQAHGLVRVAMESRSPCSRLDDVLYDKAIAVQSCACGEIKRTHVANENVRRRGDELRKRRAAK